MPHVLDRILTPLLHDYRSMHRSIHDVFTISSSAPSPVISVQGGGVSSSRKQSALVGFPSGAGALISVMYWLFRGTGHYVRCLKCPTVKGKNLCRANCRECSYQKVRHLATILQICGCSSEMAPTVAWTSSRNSWIGSHPEQPFGAG